MAAATFLNQVLVLVGISAIMTVGVYGLVAGIVKLDDAGLYLSMRKGEGLGAQLKRKLGFALLSFAPYMMKALSIIGTIAMFLVGGAILVHGLPSVHHAMADIAASINHGFLSLITTMVLEGLFGVLAGILALGIYEVIKPSIQSMMHRFKKANN